MHKASMIALSAILAGCSTFPAPMKLAPELAGVEPWAVHGRGAGQKLEFGRWQVTAPPSFTTQQNSVGSGSPLPLPVDTELKVETNTRLVEDLTSFQFVLGSQSNPSRSLSAECFAIFRFAQRTVIRTNSTDETELTQPGYPRFDCRFTGAEAGRLSVHADYTTQRDAGTSEFSPRTWQVRTLNARYAYEILRDGKVVAALDAFGDARIWMDPELSPPEEDELALTLSALSYFGSLLELRDI